VLVTSKLVVFLIFLSPIKKAALDELEVERLTVIREKKEIFCETSFIGEL